MEDDGGEVKRGCLDGDNLEGELFFVGVLNDDEDDEEANFEDGGGDDNNRDEEDEEAVSSEVVETELEERAGTDLVVDVRVV